MKRHPALKAVKKKRKQCKRLVAKKGEAASRQAMTSNFARTHTCARVLFAVDSLPVAGHAESRDPRQGQIAQAARARVPNCRSSVSVSLYLSLLHKTAAPATTTKKKRKEITKDGGGTAERHRCRHVTDAPRAYAVSRSRSLAEQIKRKRSRGGWLHRETAERAQAASMQAGGWCFIETQQCARPPRLGAMAETRRVRPRSGPFGLTTFRRRRVDG